MRNLWVCRLRPRCRELREVLAAVLILGSLVFFYQCVSFLARRDYVASVILMFVGKARGQTDYFDRPVEAYDPAAITSGKAEEQAE